MGGYFGNFNGFSSPPDERKEDLRNKEMLLVGAFIFFSDVNSEEEYFDKFP